MVINNSLLLYATFKDHFQAFCFYPIWGCFISESVRFKVQNITTNMTNFILSV